ADLAHTAAVGRRHLAERLAVVCASTEDLRLDLESALRQGVLGGRRRRPAGALSEITFLLDDRAVPANDLHPYPLAAAAFNECLDLITASLGFRPASGLAIVFSPQCAMPAWWRSWGVAPSQIVVRGDGVYAAAFIAGTLSLEDAAKAVAYRVASETSGSGTALETAIAHELSDQLKDLEYRHPIVEVVSGSTGFSISDRIASARFWREYGATPAQSDSFQPTTDCDNRLTVDLGAGARPMLDTVRELYVSGVDIDWKAFRVVPGGRKIALPTYPFESRRCWFRGRETNVSADLPAGQSQDAAGVFEIAWRLQPRVPPPAARIDDDGVTLVFAHPTGVTQDVVAQVGARRIIVEPGQTFRDAGDRFEIDPQSAGDYLELLETIARRGLTIGHILFLWNLDVADGVTDDTIEPSIEAVCWPLVRLTSALEEALPPDRSARIVIVTRGAHAVTGVDRLVSPVQATAAAVGRVMASEHPQWSCRLIDVPAFLEEGWEEAVVTEGLGDALEPEICLRGTQRWAARLVRKGMDVAASPFHLRADSTYLITGGLGGLGLTVGQWMAANGAGHIVLMGRNGITEDQRFDAARRAIELMRGSGARVTVAQADVSDREQLRSVFAALAAERPLRGIVHAAGA